MADKEEKEEISTEGGEKKKSNLLLIIIIGVLFLILVIGAVVAFLMMGNEEPAATNGAPTQQEASADAPKEDAEPSDSSLTEVGLMYPLDGFTVNLLSESGKRYLKVEMNLELEGEELSPELDTKKPVFRDVIIRILSSKSLEEISTIKGKEKLKEQLVNELNMRLKDGKVKNVYFTDFVVQ
ncbi:flagellar basal body-associated protein FliL [Sulfuricurvum sp.]|uniref:flagellar basal body-associated protein FliL n=1 Tax=Sulfuricurvum sp. TaxID=2025608 RepID=UPI0026280801|nr:flagellar basal body-associated protein FliL [Sulfuricurvum sp.]MDD2779928.1 flagellar basal body-associated protein FliL [Sulfuricurvum sp.]